MHLPSHGVNPKVQMPPEAFKIRSERLMLDMAQWMLDAYGMQEGIDKM